MSAHAAFNATLAVTTAAMLRSLSSSSEEDSSQSFSMSHVTAWVGLQAFTAVFIIIAVVACALLMRPIVASTLTARAYNPI